MANKWTGQTLLANDMVQEHLNRAMEWGRLEWDSLNHSVIEHNITVVPMESPIEAVFYTWWDVISRLHYFEQTLAPQQEVTAQGKLYRPDFLIWPEDMSSVIRARELQLPSTGVVVELDGHEFHERTKEQVAYRNQRDRDLQADGWQVLHFSGAELNQKPVDCVEQAHWAACRTFFLIQQSVSRAERSAR